MRVPRTSRTELRAAVDDETPNLTSESPLRLLDDGAVVPVPQSSESLRPLLEELLTALRSHRTRNARLVVKTGGKVLFLRAPDIDWIEAAGNYVRLHLGSG